MSLDVDLMVVQPCSVFSRNITHNLGKMASMVVLTKDLTLYDVLWRPDEHEMVYAKDIKEYLRQGWTELIEHPEKYTPYNPENGWGNYQNLVGFVYTYMEACYDNPDAELRISR